MAYALSYKAVRDKTTLYARIKDKETSLFWNALTSAWVSTAVAGCNLTLTESGTEPGVYTGSATFTPANGGIYEIFVYDSGDADYSVSTIEVYSSKTKTVLQVINSVQQELGFPLSTALTDNFAKKILANMNIVLLDLLPGAQIFDHLKVQGTITINTTKPLYRLAPVNVDSVDSLTYLRRPDLTDIYKAPTDYYFRTIADSYIASSTTGKPEIFRISQRDANFPILEFAPIPDDAYIVSYECLKSAKELTAITDYVPLNRVIKAGAKMLTKQGQGRDASAEAAIYEAALAQALTVGGNTISGDFEV